MYRTASNEWITSFAVMLLFLALGALFAVLLAVGTAIKWLYSESPWFIITPVSAAAVALTVFSVWWIRRVE